jgi:acyl-CoA thioester hydrolase
MKFPEDDMVFIGKSDRLLAGIGLRPTWSSGFFDRMMQSRTPITVRYAETDMMGVVYHGSYLPWFEVGRTDLMKQYGLPYRQLEAEGFYLPVLEVGAKYLKPAHYDDPITIVTTLREKPLLRIKLEYEVRRGDELLTTGFTLHAFIDRAGKPVRPPASFQEKMNAVFSGQ